MFDGLGFRRREARTNKCTAIAARTRKRIAGMNFSQRAQRRLTESSEIRPSLASEIRLFKTIFKQMIRQDVSKDQASLFQSETNQSIKRLRNLGVVGHQPAIKANCLI